LKSTEIAGDPEQREALNDFSNFGSLKSTEIPTRGKRRSASLAISAISAR